MRRVDCYLGEERKSIWLGKMSESQALTIKSRIEYLIAAKEIGVAPDAETSRWLATMGDDLYDRLAKHELVPARITVEVPSLAAFLDAYIATRTDVAPSTLRGLTECRDHLINHFGADRRLDTITPGDAEDFWRHLRGKLGENTTRRFCGRCKQFFRYAAKKYIIVESPFAEMKRLTVEGNEERQYFVTREEAQAVLNACPDNQWRLLFALCRFGGLRCPSEPLVIRWGDVNWETGRIRVNSPKTGPRDIPIFPELRPYLDLVWNEVPEGTEFLITRYRDANANLRTQLQRIIKRAGLEPWPKLFQNLRASRETELLDDFNIKVACEWIGNSQPVAMKHYVQLRDTDWRKATGKGADRMVGSAQHSAQRQAVEPDGMDKSRPERKREIPGESLVPAISLGIPVLPVGLEPTTY